MRIQTDSYKVYNFDELERDIQEKVLNKFRENEDFPCMSEDLSYELETLLKIYKIKYNDTPKLYYSLSYSQGDGVMFEGTVYWKSYVAIIKQSGHYYHYNSKEIELFSIKTDKDASEKVYKEFNGIYVDICQKLEKIGYDNIDYILDEKNITENIEANEYEFKENGVLI